LSLEISTVFMGASIEFSAHHAARNSRYSALSNCTFTTWPDLLDRTSVRVAGSTPENSRMRRTSSDVQHALGKPGYINVASDFSRKANPSDLRLTTFLPAPAHQ
jgi:hypothetical protein